MGENVETVTNFIFLGSKITVDSDCSHEIKTLTPWKALTNVDTILKSRDITLPTKVLILKAMVFPVVMYGCEIWIIKKAECWRSDVFGTGEVVLEKTLESTLDCKEIKPVNPKGNQLWIFTGRTDAKAETPILWPPDVKSGLTKKTLMLGKIEGRKRRGRQRMRWLDSRVWANSRRQWRTGEPGTLQLMGSQGIRHNWVTEQQAPQHLELPLVPRPKWLSTVMDFCKQSLKKSQ